MSVAQDVLKDLKAELRSKASNCGTTEVDSIERMYAQVLLGKIEAWEYAAEQAVVYRKHGKWWWTHPKTGTTCEDCFDTQDAAAKDYARFLSQQ